ncbi:hypothetical protein [Chlorobium sp. N1]|uniref:hypothetical protein n=1 Tax=Chlorobium sp. N1 TaxID=2491138 RepID=UPI001039FD46|nr:hypothetical protein [Chlorobium sp. N1]TCD46823.1 hypothetical protein E0L29_11265 [Chlorobium sp. N1]
MPNGFAKLLLVATSLSPLLGAVAVNNIALNRPWTSWVPWMGVGIFLIVLCFLLLRYFEEVAQEEKISIVEFERNDKDVLAFLLAYLLPFLSSKSMDFQGQWLTGAYILLIIFLVVSHTGAFHFNPVMALVGYHFYGIRTKDGVSQLLICRGTLKRLNQEVSTVRLAPNIYLTKKNSSNAG